MGLVTRREVGKRAAGEYFKQGHWLSGRGFSDVPRQRVLPSISTHWSMLPRGASTGQSLLTAQNRNVKAHLAHCIGRCYWSLLAGDPPCVTSSAIAETGIK
jgi:hypothetical protein